MKSYIFESVKELTTFLESQGRGSKPEIHWSFQVVDTIRGKDGTNAFTIVDRFLVIMR